MSVDLHPAIVATSPSSPARQGTGGPVGPIDPGSPAGAPATLDLHWPDEPACAAFARGLAAPLRALPVPLSVLVELHGPLGAGKTTFVRHLLRALGVEGRIKSPTYTVLEPYEAPALATPLPQPAIAISHLDFYRFDDPREWADAGLRDVFAAPGLKLVEWPDKAAGVLPAPDLRLAITPLPDEARAVRLEARGPVGLQLLAGCRAAA